MTQKNRPERRIIKRRRIFGRAKTSSFPHLQSIAKIASITRRSPPQERRKTETENSKILFLLFGNPKKG
jgi:hypothetical protein